MPADMLTKSFDTKMRVEDEDERTVVARISTTAVDRDGDVLIPGGVDLKDFRENPVVLFGHQSDRMPVGKATRMEQTPTALLAKVKFTGRPAAHPPTAEWVPDTLFHLFREGVLRAFSVGFMIDKARDATDRDRRKFGDTARRIITKWRLLEFSVVPVPANQEALAMAVSKGLIAASRPEWCYAELVDDYDLPSPYEFELPIFEFDFRGRS